MQFEGHMAIISRGAGVALLLVGLALLPGNTRAAEPSYDDYVAQVKAGKIEIDYTAFRLAYAASSKYAPYGVVEIASKLKKAYDAGDCPSAMAHANEVLEVNFVHMDAHKIAAFCQKKAGNEEEARRHYAMFLGLFSSVLKSGDGKSPETAFVRHRSRRRVQCVGDRGADAGQAGTGEPRGIRLRPVRGQVAGIRPNGNALFQRRPPARAIGANVTEEAVDDHAIAALCSLE
ncbi:hypothetical protein V1283_001606 [Bradyrhizobium sp. AZCC 2262]|uniref:DUF4919 domain-containing protein n=1 Tax=Bradyrhizobium sp. AZCC 2262 TaxID=3117022 RepID=UPI002FEEBDDB